MIECAQAGLGQSHRMETGLGNPSPSCIFLISGRPESVLSWEDSAFLAALPRFLLLRMQQKEGESVILLAGKF